MYRFLAMAMAAVIMYQPVNQEVMKTLDGEDDAGYIEIYDRDGTPYVSIRDAAEKLDAGVLWDEDESELTVELDGYTVSVSADKPYISANGRYFWTDEIEKTEEGDLLAPATAVCRALSAELSYDAGGRAHITKGETLTAGEDFYNEEDVYWLSRIIHAEAGSESFEGQVAVGNVVMNRVASEEFPDTVKSVIFDRQYGVQFTPAYSGAIYNDPYESCVIAAYLALDGADIVENCLYFASVYTSCWASRNREFYETIDRQNFYI